MDETRKVIEENRRLKVQLVNLQRELLERNRAVRELEQKLAEASEQIYGLHRQGRRNPILLHMAEFST